MGQKKTEVQVLSAIEKELVDICASFIDKPDEYKHVPQFIFEQADKWETSMVQQMQDSQIIAPVDVYGIDTMKNIYRDTLVRQYTILKDGPTEHTEKGPKEHHLYPGLRSNYNLLKQFYTAYALTPMSRRNKNMGLEPRGGAASHGNSKSNDVQDLINGGQ